jgi:hypothetical protein
MKTELDDSFWILEGGMGGPFFFEVQGRTFLPSPIKKLDKNLRRRVPILSISKIFGVFFENLSWTKF